jgi:hypothetical protein
MIGAIVGEHTYNVDAYDRLQTYYVKAASYAGESFRFAYDGEDVDDFVARPEFANARQERFLRALDLPRAMSGKAISAARRSAAPLPEQSLQRRILPALLRRPDLRPRPDQSADGADADRSRAPSVSGYPKLDENDAGAVYKAIMDPDISLAYVAASIRRSIDDYKRSPAWISRAIPA